MYGLNHRRNSYRIVIPAGGVIATTLDSLRRVWREMTKLVPSALSKGETEGCPSLPRRAVGSRFRSGLYSLSNRYPLLCHPERSERICCAPCGFLKSFLEAIFCSVNK